MPSLYFRAASAKSPFWVSEPPQMSLRLIHSLGVKHVRSPGDIMPFVDQYPAFVLYPISVWSARTEAHENDTFGVSQPEVHPALQI
jgi:hypothetical protein